MHNVSVIICTYTEQRWQGLCAAVQSVQRQTLRAVEILVVVDYCPGLLQMAKGQLSGVVVLENTHARGLRGARTSGARAAQGALLAFLDDDAVAEPDWLEQLCAGYDREERVLGTGGAITPVWNDQKKPAWFPEEFYWVVGCTYRGMPEGVAVIRNPIGANMSFRREVFETIGAFRCDGADLAHQHAGGCEETEFFICARQRWPDHAVLYLPAARVLHYVPSERMRVRYVYTRCYAEGISKAVIGAVVGKRGSLESEVPYVLRTLTLGIVRNLGLALFQGDVCGGLARSWVIVSGLLVTVAGYIVGNILLLAHFKSSSFASGLVIVKDGATSE